jgi:outer membrane protein OmpA-like peptidoglycan-associated protein
VESYGYDDSDESSGRWLRNLGLAAVAVAVAAAGWIFVRPALQSDSGAPRSVLELDTASSTTPADDAATQTGDGTATTTTVAADAAAPIDSTDAGAPSDTAVDSSTTDGPGDTAVDDTVTQATPVPYPTLPDGSPEPVLAIFDTNTITLSGAVPSEAAKERLAALAIANSKTPAELLDLMTINPAVPINVGVRVLELTSTRFPEGSAEIRPEHAAEFDRVANVLNALPNVTVLVVGHADQRGDEERNYRLSEERAQAVVNYLVSKGIAASRLSSRAVGESDLLSIADDDAALALNRRTEFVFYGLLIE